MTALDDLGVWLQGLLDAARADGAASRQAEVDAAAAALADAQAANAGETLQIAQLTAQLAAKQAELDAYVAAHPDAPTAKPQGNNAVMSPLIEISDFGQQGKGWFLGAKSLTTPGRYRMTPHTSTKAAPTAANTTNTYRVMMGGLASKPATGSGPAGLEYANFNLEGTVQGPVGGPEMEHGGLIIGYALAPEIHHFTASGFLSTGSAPPKEVATVDLLHTDNPHVYNFVLDGKRVTDGAVVASTLLEFNYLPNGARIENGIFHNARYGFALAAAYSTGVQYVDNCWFAEGCRAYINIEQSIGGEVHFRGCHFGTPTGRPWIAQVSAQSGSTKVTFEDCTFDVLPQVRTYQFDSGPQLDADIRCIVKGQDVTADPSKFLIRHKD